MTDFDKRIDKLSDKKKQLLKMFLQKEGVGPRNQTTAAPPRNEVEQTLADIWSEVLGLASVGIHDNYFEIGGDSIQSIQIIAKANRAGLQLTTNQLFEHLTIASLARVVGRGPGMTVDQGPVTGRMPVTAYQRRMLEDPVEASRGARGVVLETPIGTTRDELASVMGRIWTHHDALRLRFVPVDGGWAQEHGPGDQPVPIASFDLADIPEPGWDAEIAARFQELVATIDITEGPLPRGAFFAPPPGARGRFLLIVHRLVADDLSMRILLEDFMAVHAMSRRGETLALPPKTSSFKAWVDLRAGLAAKPATAITDGTMTPRPDFPNGPGLEGATAVLTRTLPPERVRALREQVLPELETRLEALLPAVLLHVLGPEGRIQIKGLGRETHTDRVATSRTVGCFQIDAAMTAEGRDRPLAEAVASVNQRLQSIVNSDHDGEPSAAGVGYLHLGRLEQQGASGDVARPVGLAIRPLRHPEATRPFPLRLVSYVSREGLHLEWDYAGDQFVARTIAALADRFTASLERLIDTGVAVQGV